jgi:hypothetical protein
MSKHLFDNIKKAKWHLALLFGAIAWQYNYDNKRLYLHIFGRDGNDKNYVK